MRKLISVLAMLLCAISALAYDFSSITEGLYPLELYYAINADGKTVTLVQGPETYSSQEVNIPQKVTFEGKTYTVTIIGSKAFEDANIKEVIIPEGVVDILSDAFSKSQVSHIQFPASLRFVGEYAFARTVRLQAAEFREGLESIGNGAFAGPHPYGSGIKEVLLPKSLKTIGESAFSGCEFLTEINIPEGIKCITEECFEYCSRLQSVTLPAGLEEIESQAFYCCGTESGLTFSINLPSSIKNIGEQAFYGSHLREINMPSSLKTLGKESFRQTLLKEVALPNSVTEVGEGAFYDCHNLENIVFSSMLTALPKDVCSYCDHLVKVTIPEGIQNIGWGAFQHCERLNSIVLPESIVELDGFTFGCSGLQKINFPSKLKELPAGMFSHCGNLTDIAIPSSVEKIGRLLFEYCNGLKSVDLPKTISSVESDTFRGCTSLTSVIIPEGVRYIGNSCFADCDMLKEVILPESLEELDGAFENCKNIEAITLPKKLKKIGAYGFEGCLKLNKLIIHNYIESIGFRSFTNCPKLTEVHINKNIPPQVIPPEGWSYCELVYGDNNITLFIPRGTKATYEATPKWQDFSQIVEEDVDGSSIYQVKAIISGGSAEVKINGEACQDSGNEVTMGTDVSILIEPLAGYALKSLFCNGEDVTSDVVNGQYSIVSISQNYALDIVLKEQPVVLRIRSGNGGCVDANVEKGEKFSFSAIADDGWQVNSIMFNGSDVTAQLVDGVFTTPALNSDATLTISFEETGGAAVQSATLRTVRAHISSTGLLTVSGCKMGEEISIYTPDGKTVYRLFSKGYSDSIQLQFNGVFLVKTSFKVIKVMW